MKQQCLLPIRQAMPDYSGFTDVRSLFIVLFCNSCYDEITEKERMQKTGYPHSIKEWLLFSHAERISIMKTSMKKKAIGICAALCAVSAMSATMLPASAATKTNSHYYTCLAHKNKGTDMYIQLAASYSGKKVTGVWWNSSYAHWPNAFTFGNTANCTSYARGTYTAYSSLITQWASLSFSSTTDTIYIYV